MEHYRALKRKQAIKPWKVTQEPEMNTTKWMKPTWKGMIPTTQYCGKSKKIDSCQEGRAGHRIFRACEKTLYDTTNCSTPGLPVHHQLPEFTETQVHRVSDAIQPSHPLSSPSPLAPIPPSISLCRAPVWALPLAMWPWKNCSVSLDLSPFCAHGKTWIR